MDEEDTLASLAEGVTQSEYIKRADIWIDGFHGFTPQEYRVLREIMTHANRVTIALTLDKPYPNGNVPHELDLFHPTAVTYIKLEGIADEMGLDMEYRVLQPDVLPRFKESPLLAHLERGYDRKKRWTEAPGRSYSEPSGRRQGRSSSVSRVTAGLKLKGLYAKWCVSLGKKEQDTGKWPCLSGIWENMSI